MSGLLGAFKIVATPIKVVTGVLTGTAGCNSFI